MKSSVKYQELSEEASDTNEDISGPHKPKKFAWKSFLKWSFIGYMVGLLATILWFTLFSNILTYLRSQSTRKILYILLIYACVLLCSRNARCISVLILPILFSSKGRSALIATALVLAATGPTANILRNVDVLIESISCGQQQLKEALERMLDVVKRPLVAVKNAIETAVAEMKKVLKSLQVVLVRIQKLILEILDSIKKAFDWLANVVSVCNKEMGTPFDRCLRVSDSAMEDCRQKMGSLGFLCNVTDVLRALCYSVKFIDALCVLVDFVSDSIIATVTERLDRFKRDIKTMFSVSVKFDHDFSFKTVATKNLTEVGSDIVAEIQKEFNGIFFLFGWLELVGGLMIFFLVVKALLYKSKYLSSDRFDNHFITRDFVAIDIQRRKVGKDAVLPLTRKERGKYVKISSCSLVRAEMHKISRTILFIIVPTVQLLCICLTDYSLFWLLATISHFGRQEAGLEIPPFLSVNVSGSGLTADIFRGIVHAFEPLGEKYEIDPRPCLPLPYPPTYAKYWEIGGLVGLAWVFLFCQPYGLRCRQVIMGAFYPSRSKERALWLYNHILWNRDSFMKFARRQARSRILKDKSAEAYSLTGWINAKLSRYWFFRAVFRVHVPLACNICATPLKGSEDMVRCQQQGCRGMYCAECYAELNNMCCLCRKPIDYGDLSDVSEEKDSSDEMDGVEVS